MKVYPKNKRKIFIQFNISKRTALSNHFDDHYSTFDLIETLKPDQSVTERYV